MKKRTLSFFLERPNMYKIYLAISTDEKELDNLKELTSIYKDFDGLAVTFHGSTDSDAYKLLLDRKGDGFVECIPYFGAHSHDLNHILFNPQIKIGDWILLRDSAERINPNFSSNIYPFIRMLENNEVNTVYQHSKLLLFKRFPHQKFVSTPHWGFQGGQDKVVSVESQNWFKDDSEYCYSVRNQRAPFSWIDHYVRYYLILDSNHNLLGAHNFGNEFEVFQQKETVRSQFLLYLRKIGVDNNLISLKNYILNNKLTPELQYFFNNALILNQFYCYHVLKDTDLQHDLKAKLKQI